MVNRDGESLGGIAGVHLSREQKRKAYLKNKMVDKALEELGYDYFLVPLNRDGVVQLGFLKSCRNRERLAKAIGCDTRPIQHLSECDGVLENVPYIIAIDFQGNRIVRALKQIELYDQTIGGYFVNRSNSEQILGSDPLSASVRIKVCKKEFL